MVGLSLARARFGDAADAPLAARSEGASGDRRRVCMRFACSGGRLDDDDPMVVFRFEVVKEFSIVFRSAVCQLS
jgi:hypothetical protein